jgi:hypothetical protein
VTQPVQGDNIVKLPKSPPMFAAIGKVTEVLVNVFIPLMEKLPVMVAADALPLRKMQIIAAAAITELFFMSESPKS